MKHKIQMKRNIQFVLAMLVSLTSCSDDDDSADTGVGIEVNYDFQTDLDVWEADFADYPVDEETFYELQHEISPLPEPLDGEQNSLRQTGNNHSDDLFMFIKRKITGLEPNRSYELTFNLEFATNAPDDSFGVGGSPASSVYIKAGATQTEPEKEIDSLDMYRMNIDKGNQASEGEEMINLGDFSNGSDEDTYALKTLENKDPFTVQSDESGGLWVIIGTDSGFEATTTIYYNKISVEFK